MSLPNADQKQRDWARRVVEGLRSDECPHTPHTPKKRTECNWCLMNALTKAKYGAMVR